MQARSATPFSSVVRYLVDVWRGWRERRARLVEFDSIDSVEMQRTATDLGISVSELRDLAGRDKNAADLLQRRLQSLKLNPAAVEVGVMRDLQRCCSKCGSKTLCVHELEDLPKVTSWPEYCPNEQTIRAIVAEKDKGNQAK